MQVHPARCVALSPNPARLGPVVYWMSRDQRADDNWALLAAAARAQANGAPLLVVFCLTPSFPGATARHYAFMLTGLAETEEALRARGIPLVLLAGDPAETLPLWLASVEAGCCLTDFDPSRIKVHWKRAVAAHFAGAFSEVDAHNVVPCRVASTKREYAAATLRPKITRLLPEFLEPYPEVPVFPETNLAGCPLIDWKAAAAGIAVDASVPPAGDIVPGPDAGLARLERFIDETLPVYHERRNDPNAAATSGLSPYFHFGQLAPARAALDVLIAKRHAPAGGEAFLEELIVRRELSDNFCHYEPDYDTFAALPAWAQKTLAAHPASPGNARPQRPAAAPCDGHRCARPRPAPAPAPHNRPAPRDGPGNRPAFPATLPRS